MKVAASTDWRDGIPFDTPLIVAEILPGEETRCSVCGGDSALRSRTELWVIKHRHPKHHDGYVRFYCPEHLPEIAPVEPVLERPAVRARRPAAPRAAAATRTPAAPEKQRAVCPECYVEVSALGLCGICGQTIA
ncbi:glucose-6-phosphate dehydrogenase [Microbacterium sp. zg.B48]|uniref:glucose-6-phosphate dehydrogenase n=1 Tax=unclassified Microbacterium TaxID=2609290 RepID=UPI00214B9BC3|nr:MULTISPECIES: glucose-6-phosphate dehydrogenase [unclassified Microbacterium]MCR2763076.1 glucose-6-phosphate dehydrogenase [Microbacterium sp. zg.B48]MCR2808609.1 glucose-6-phosphate dehydrogenase [Microbacterium sp. zg.B185]WIM18957.1 glucose-6-phosphate dehydrogenase [Microbacterium sp. zg-B185]